MSLVPLAYLWDVDTGPEELQVLPHLLRFEFGVEDGELGEHPHVSALQPQGGLQHGDQLLEVPAVLQGTHALNDTNHDPFRDKINNVKALSPSEISWSKYQNLNFFIRASEGKST